MPEQKSIPIDELHIDPTNVRPVDRETGETIPDLDSRRGLYPDVKDEGVLQPLVVRPHDGEYGIVIGSRRFAAAKGAGLDEVPCVIREDLEDDDEKAQLESMKENLHRTDIPDWRKRELVQEMYDETDGRKSKYKRANKVADKLNVSRETAYGYLDFEKLDPTLNIRQKEPSERTDEEIELLESSLSENTLLATDEAEDLNEDEYKREKAKGFPALKKVPTKVGKKLHRSDFFLELQEEDLEKAHDLATEAAEAGQKNAEGIIREREKERKGEKPERRERLGRKPKRFTIVVGAKTVDMLDRWIEERESIETREQGIVQFLRKYLLEKGYDKQN